MIKQLLLTSLLSLSFSAAANDVGALTPNDVYTIKNIKCPIISERILDPQIEKCLTENGIYNSLYFIWNSENITYKGESEGDKVHGRIIPTYFEIANL